VRHRNRRATPRHWRGCKHRVRPHRTATCERWLALRDLGPWIDWEGSEADCCAGREIRPDAYATGFVTLTLARSQHLIPGEHKKSTDRAVAWIDRQLANPYPAEPRNNRHNSADAEMPQFRNNLYTNAGHMWAFLARTIHENKKAPWIAD